MVTNAAHIRKLFVTGFAHAPLVPRLHEKVRLTQKVCMIAQMIGSPVSRLTKHATRIVLDSNSDQLYVSLLHKQMGDLRLDSLD